MWASPPPSVIPRVRGECFSRDLIHSHCAPELLQKYLSRFCKFSAQTVTSCAWHRVPDKAALADICFLVEQFRKLASVKTGRGNSRAAVPSCRWGRDGQVCSLQFLPWIVKGHNAAASLQTGEQARQSPSAIQPVFPSQSGGQLHQCRADEFLGIRDSRALRQLNRRGLRVP